MKDIVKKQVKLLILTIMMITVLTGCNTNMSLTFNVETGDSIEVELNTTDGYGLKADGGHFIVSDPEETEVLQGFFVTKEMYDAYLTAVAESDATVITNATQNGCTYMQYQLELDGYTENNFICWVDGSSTGVVVASVDSQEAAEKAFGLLTFSYE